jgi:hypothetical protein
MHFVKNNVVPLVLGDYLNIDKKKEKRWKLTLYEEVHATSAKVMAATQILGGRHVTNQSEAESESDTWTSQGSMGPPRTQTVKEACHA